MSRPAATIIGFCAILLWSLLALLTVYTAPVPPLQLSAMSFAIGGAIGLVWSALRGVSLSRLVRAPWRVWLLGVGGLFGYHFLYFSALRLAPAAQASLIAYLWPLLIVLFSGLLPGERLRMGHVAGAALALGGAGALFLQGGEMPRGAFLLGYLLALGCALTWSGYSVLSRRTADVPTDMVGPYCLATAGLSLLAHLAFERTAWPANAMGWGAIVLLGLGPVGLAFYLWDIGMKKGDIQLLGVASYAAPLVSTLILVLVGETDASPTILIAAGLISLGAVLAARSGRAGREKPAQAS